MRTTQTVIQCNLCGIDSNPIGVEQFSAVGAFDFCRWCMSGPIARTECGDHAVTVTGDKWECNCGMTIAMLQLKLWSHGVSHDVMAAVPNFASATAVIHVQTPNWPATY